MTNSSKEKKAQSSRRDWLKNVALLGAVPFVSPLLMANTERAPSTNVSNHQKLRLIVSTYSYWHFQPVKYPIERVIENAAK